MKIMQRQSKQDFKNTKNVNQKDDEKNHERCVQCAEINK